MVGQTTMASLDSLIASIVASPGMSVGLSEDQLRASWRALGVHIEESLLKKRSVIVPGFCHFVLQEQVNHMGTWESRTAWVPAAAPLPAFVSAYGLRGAPVMSQVHVGAKVPTFLNGCAVAELACMPRNAVINAISDIVRQVGAVVSSGAALELDMGFCMLDFSQRTMRVRWGTDFLAHFGEALGTSLTRAAQKEEKRPATARAVSSATLPSPRQEAAARTALAANTASEASVTAPRQCAVAIPAPPATRAAPTAGGAVRPCTAVRTTPPVVAPASPSPSSSRLSSRSATPRRGIDDALSRPTTPRQPSVGTPRLTRHDIEEIVCQVPKQPNTFHRRRTRKALYRRMRNHAYEESWAAQRLIKARDAEAERQSDRQRVEVFRQYLLDQQAREAAEQAARLQEGREIDRLNSELVTVRDAARLPRKCPPGDIFDARPPSHPSAHDVATLKRQMVLREQQRAREREEDRAHGQLAAQVAAQAKEEAVRDREAKRRVQREMCVMYEGEIARRRQERATYRSTLTNGGALLFSGDDGTQAERLELSRVKQRTREFQEENRRMMEERDTQRRQQEAAEREKNEEARRQRLAREQAFREQQRRQDAARKADLRATWTSQMCTRELQAKKERQERRQWKELTYLRNESSSDEGDEGMTKRTPTAT